MIVKPLFRTSQVIGPYVSVAVKLAVMQQAQSCRGSLTTSANVPKRFSKSSRQPVGLAAMTCFDFRFVETARIGRRNGEGEQRNLYAQNEVVERRGPQHVSLLCWVTYESRLLGPVYALLASLMLPKKFRFARWNAKLRK